MKRIFATALLVLFFTNAFSQIPNGRQKKEETKLEFALKILEENVDTLSEYQIAAILDSLDREKIRKSSEQEHQYKLNEKGDTIYSIGDKAQGGIIFWVDSSLQHGLVASEEDLASEVFPFYLVEKYIGKTYALSGDSVYAGRFNTEQIISNKSVGYYAALICEVFQGGGYKDWYLPSKFELTLLYKVYTRRIIPNFYRDFYWSSSEEVGDTAWLYRFYDGQLHNYKKYGSSFAFRVRAVRAF